MNLIEMRTATITSKGQISIPNEIRKLESFKIGAKIAILTLLTLLSIGGPEFLLLI